MRRLGILIVVTLVAIAAAAPAGAATTSRRGARRRATGDDPSLDAAEKLLTSVPADARGTCVRIDVADTFGDKFPGALGGVNCPSPTAGVDSVAYILMPQETLNSLAFLNFTGGDLPAQPATPGGCDYSSTWNYDGQASSGSDACVSSDTSDAYVWTADAQHIFGFALSTTKDSNALHQWWKASSGPLQEPDAVTFASTNPTTRVKVGKTLLKQTGKATGCKLIDRDASTYQSSSLAWRYLPWLGAALSCRAPQKQGPMQYFQLNPIAAKSFATQLEASTINQQTPTKHSAYCDTPRDLLTKKNTVVGQLQCFYVKGLLWMTWWHDKGAAAGMVGLMPGDNFTSPQKFTKFLIANHLP